MDNKFIKAVTAALYWYKRYDDSNPDVGMGPTLDICEQFTINLNQAERSTVISEVTKRQKV